MVLLPKCPLCWLGYTGLLSAAGLWRLAGHYAVWVPPLTLICLGVVLAVIGLRSRRRRAAGPLLLGLAASALVAVAKLQLASYPLAFAGSSLLLAAFLWSGRPAGATPSPSFPPSKGVNDT